MAPALDNLLDSVTAARNIADLRIVITGIIQNAKESQQSCKRKAQTLQDKITDLRQEKTELEKCIVDHENTISELQAKVTVAASERKDISTKIIGNTSSGNVGPTPPEIQELHDQVDNTNQYARRGAYTLSAKNNELPIFTPEECSKTIVMEKILKHTGIKLDEADISIAHRLGRKPETPDGDRRGIRFRLVRRDLGPLIVSACKEKRPPIFVNPSLTPTRAKIYHDLRKLKSDYGHIIKSCRATLNGDIEAYSTGNSRVNSLRKHVLNTKIQFEKFVADVVRVPVHLASVDSQAPDSQEQRPSS